jgi:hypothetical protein
MRWRVELNRGRPTSNARKLSRGPNTRKPENSRRTERAPPRWLQRRVRRRHFCTADVGSRSTVTREISRDESTSYRSSSPNTKIRPPAGGTAMWSTDGTRNCPPSAKWIVNGTNGTACTSLRMSAVITLNEHYREAKEVAIPLLTPPKCSRA